MSFIYTPSAADSTSTASVAAISLRVSEVEADLATATSDPTPFSITKRDGVGSGNFTNLTSTGALYTDHIFSRGAELDIGSNSTTVKLACGTGVQTVDLGASGAGATTINIGGAGDTVNIAGTLTYINSTNTQITDKVITLNKGGAASSAGLSGLEFEEAGSAANAYMRIASSRDKLELKAPTGSTITLNQSLATTDSPTFAALTCPSVTTATNQLLLTQTGDTQGTSALLICNRDGSNGCVVRQLNAVFDMCDIGLYSQASTQTGTIRLEKRTTGGNLMSALNNTYGELQFRPNTSPIAAPPFAVGYAQCTVLPTCLLSTGAITASGRITTAGETNSLGLNFTTASTKMLALTDAGTTTNLTQHNFDGLGAATNTVRYQAKATTTDHVFSAATSSSASNTLMTVKGNGVVTIPKILSVVGGNKAIVLYDAGSTSDVTAYNYNGFGTEASQTSCYLNNTANDFVFYAATSATTRNELLRVKGNGTITTTSTLSSGAITSSGAVTGSSLVATGDASATYTCNWGGAMTGYTTSIKFVRKNGIVTVKMITSPGATGTGAGGAITCVPGIAAGFLPSGGDYLLNVVPLSLSGATVFVNGLFSLDPAGVLLIDMPGSGATWTGTCIIGGFSTCYPV